MVISTEVTVGDKKGPLGGSVSSGACTLHQDLLLVAQREGCSGVPEEPDEGTSRY